MQLLKQQHILLLVYRKQLQDLQPFIPSLESMLLLQVLVIRQAIKLLLVMMLIVLLVEPEAIELVEREGLILPILPLLLLALVVVCSIIILG